MRCTPDRRWGKITEVICGFKGFDPNIAFYQRHWHEICSLCLSEFRLKTLVVGQVATIHIGRVKQTIGTANAESSIRITFHIARLVTGTTMIVRKPTVVIVGPVLDRNRKTLSGRKENCAVFRPRSELQER